MGVRMKAIKRKSPQPSICAASRMGLGEERKCCRSMNIWLAPTKDTMPMPKYVSSRPKWETVW